jgi:DNA repair photolyase
MAAESEPLEEKRRVRYLEIAARSYVGECSGKRAPFDWTVNPYRGCEFGCKYCYARYTHEFMELPVEEFETRIFVKEWAPEVFRKEVRRLREGDRVAFGTATDCYQPAERRYGLTRKMMELMARESRGLRIGVTTKSDLVARDADLFAEMGKRNEVRVSMTVTTVDAGLARKLEPYAPRPELRMGALAELSRAGVATAVSASPALPGINDSEAMLGVVWHAARDAGVKYFYALPVFLRDSAQAVFFPWLRAEFPGLVGKYRAFFGRDAYLRGVYPEMLRERVERVRAMYGLEAENRGYKPALWEGPAQMRLFF